MYGLMDRFIRIYQKTSLSFEDSQHICYAYAKNRNNPYFSWDYIRKEFPDVSFQQIISTVWIHNNDFEIEEDELEKIYYPRFKKVFSIEKRGRENRKMFKILKSRKIKNSDLMNKS